MSEPGPTEDSKVLESMGTTARSLLLDSFTAVWIDRTLQPQRFTVTGKAPAILDEGTRYRLEVALAAADQTLQLNVVATNYSYSELGAFRDLATNALLRVNPQTVNGVLVDKFDGHIRVEAPSLSEAERQAVLEQVPADAVEFSVIPDMRLDAVHSVRWSFPPMEAGLRIQSINCSDTLDNCKSQSGFSWCTTGYVVIGDQSGLPYGMTAGHCAPSGVGWWIGENHLSPMTRNLQSESNPSNGDGEIYRISEGSTVTNRVDTGPNGHRYVNGMYSTQYLVDNIDPGDGTGRHLCFQGATSENNNCGRIVDGDGNYTYSGISTRHMHCIDHDVMGGDSGGPVYGVLDNGDARATGVVSFRRDLGIFGVFMCASSMPYMLSDFGAHLYQPK